MNEEEWWWNVCEEGGARQFEVEDKTASCSSSLELRPNLDLGPIARGREEVV